LISLAKAGGLSGCERKQQGGLRSHPMPACPTSGNSHASRGSGVHTTQQGKQCGGCTAKESLSDDPILSHQGLLPLKPAEKVINLPTQTQGTKAEFLQPGSYGAAGLVGESTYASAVVLGPEDSIVCLRTPSTTTRT